MPLARRTACASELFAAGVVSSAAQETSATFTPDGKTVYFMHLDFRRLGHDGSRTHRTASSGGNVADGIER
jgi:hypothetical protein